MAQFRTHDMAVVSPSDPAYDEAMAMNARCAQCGEALADIFGTDMLGVMRTPSLPVWLRGRGGLGDAVAEHRIGWEIITCSRVVKFGTTVVGYALHPTHADLKVARGNTADVNDIAEVVQQCFDTQVAPSSRREMLPMQVVVLDELHNLYAPGGDPARVTIMLLHDRAVPDGAIERCIDVLDAGVPALARVRHGVGANSTVLQD